VNKIRNNPTNEIVRHKGIGRKKGEIIFLKRNISIFQHR
jgi:hypothetical protein